MHLLHRRCVGPDCDRPATWTDAHHIDEWHAHTGDTDLDRTVPLCSAHHQMVTTGGWHVDLDPTSRTTTWTSPTGNTIHTHPPP